MRAGIVIPARWGSTRLEGKPLKMIGSQTMLERVVLIAEKSGIAFVVATDDERIATYCVSMGFPFVLTSKECPTGSDRVYQALGKWDRTVDFVINFQGDAPFTPPHFLTSLVEAGRLSQTPVVTPICQLDWKELDALRDHKKHSPFSGTTVTIDQEGKALWFSKQILPALRDEISLRQLSPKSPVYRHIGLYGYHVSFLKTYISLPPTFYEKLEGLEQLRILEHGYKIQTTVVEGALMGGVDTLEDLEKARNYVQ